MSRLPFATGLAVLALAMPLAAQDDPVVESFELRSGADLVTACTVPADHSMHDTARGFCLGYMTGAMQLYTAAAASPNIEDFVCTDGPVARAQMRDVFLAWAGANPDMLAEPAIDSLMRAAVDAFPCAS